METHADQLFLQKSQPPGKKKKKHYILAMLVCLLIITLEINPYIGKGCSFSFNI